MTANLTGFFAGTNSPPEAATTNALIDELNAQVATVTAANSSAQASAVSAAGSANNAKISETNVSTLAQQATTTLNQANTAVTTANASVTQASASANTASTQASTATTQANAAATSATNANTSATNAAASASAAAASQSAAATSASAAASSQTAAASSASAAATSASNASSSAAAAGNSQTAAAGSASAAATSASNAATSESNAATSASTATTQATNASNSATAASGSATAASNSASAAAASAAAIALPLAITSGGTGQTTVAAATHALGLGTADTPQFTGLKLSSSTAHGLLIGQAGAGLTSLAPVAAGNLIVDNGTGADPSSKAPSAVLGVLSGRNRIINGACDVQQYSGNANGTSVYVGPMDRFQIGNSGTGGTFSQSNSTIAVNGVAKNGVRHTATAPVTSLTSGNLTQGIWQKIEGYNCYDLRGKPVIASFVFNSNVSGNFSISLADSTGSYSYVTTFAYTAGNPQYFAVPIPSIPTAASIPISSGLGLSLRIGALNTGTFQGASSGAWQAGNFVSAPGATNWASVANNFIELTELQLEAGSVATPFERRSYAQELALCQRYYQLFPTLKFWQYAGSGGAAVGTVFTFAQMRAAPSVSYASVTYGNTSGLTFEQVTASAISYYTTSSAAGSEVLLVSNVALSAEL